MSRAYSVTILNALITISQRKGDSTHSELVLTIQIRISTLLLFKLWMIDYCSPVVEKGKIYPWSLAYKRFLFQIHIPQYIYIRVCLSLYLHYFVDTYITAQLVSKILYQRSAKLKNLLFSSCQQVKINQNLNFAQ